MNLWADVVNKSPKNYRAWAHLGRTYKSEGNIKTAIILFKKSLEINPYFSYAYLFLGDSYSESGDPEKAVSYYEKIVDIKQIPWVHLRLYNNLGLTLSDSGNLSRAIEIFKKGINNYPSYLPYYVNLGVVYSKNNDIDNAILIYEKALAVKEEWYLYHNLSLAYKVKNNKIMSDWADKKAQLLKQAEGE